MPPPAISSDPPEVDEDMISRKKSILQIGPKFKALKRSSKALRDDAQAALGRLDLAASRLDLAQGQKEIEEARGSYKESFDHGERLKQACDHIKNVLVSKDKETIRIPPQTIPPPALVEKCMSIIILAFGNLDEFRFDETSKKIFFNHELEAERKNHELTRKLLRAVNEANTEKNEEIKLLEDKLKKRGESFLKKKADHKAVVTARDGTIADLEAKVKRHENTIRLQNVAIAGLESSRDAKDGELQDTISARDQDHQKLQRTIDDLDQENQTLRRTITERDQTIQKLQQTAQADSQTIYARNETIKLVRGSLVVRDQTIKNNQGTIDEQAQTIADRDQTILGLQAEVEAVQGARDEVHILLENEKSQSRTRIMALGADLTGARAEIDLLNAANLDHQRTIAQAREISFLRAGDFQRATDNLTRVIRIMRTRRDALRVSVRDATRIIREKNGLLMRSNTAIRLLSAFIRQKNADHQAAVQILNDEHQAAIGTQVEGHRRTLEKRDSDHLVAIQGLNDDHQGAIRRLDQEHQAAIDLLGDNHQKALDLRDADHRAATKLLVDDHTKALDQKDTDHQSAIQTLNGDHGQIVASRDADHQSTIQALEKDHRKALGERDLGHQAAIQRLVQDYRKALEKKDSDRQSHIKLSDQQHSQEIRDLENALGEKKTEIQAAAKDHEHAVQRHQTELQKRDWDHQEATEAFKSKALLIITQCIENSSNLGPIPAKEIAHLLLKPDHFLISDVYDYEPWTICIRTKTPFPAIISHLTTRQLAISLFGLVHLQDFGFDTFRIISLIMARMPSTTDGFIPQIIYRTAGEFFKSRLCSRAALCAVALSELVRCLLTRFPSYMESGCKNLQKRIDKVGGIFDHLKLPLSTIEIEGRCLFLDGGHGFITDSSSNWVIMVCGKTMTLVPKFMVTIDHTNLGVSTCTLQASNGMDPLSFQFQETHDTMLFTDGILSNVEASSEDMELMMMIEQGDKLFTWS